MPPFRDEHVLIIAPGSQTTLAQLGLPESYTPARLRVFTRMFPAEKNGEWEPIKVREKKVQKKASQPTDAGSSLGDNQDEILYEEDPQSDEDAVYPLENGRIVNWSCFFALLQHIYNTLSPSFHTPILLIAQPAWTLRDHEAITQFFFEKFRTPAFTIIDHAIATIYAYNTPTATVVDVGYEKCDVTAVSDFAINDIGRGVAIADCGGRQMTERLFKLLEQKGFTEDMTEQLKRSNICEVLGPNTPLPTEKGSDANPAAIASTGLNGPEATAKNTSATNGLPRGPGRNTEVGDEAQDDEEGVLDVASIVTSGKTSEYLARKEREKAERAAAKKAGGDAAAAAAKPVRLPNSQRARNTFYYTEQRPANENEEDAMQVDEPSPPPAHITAPKSMPEDAAASASATEPAPAPTPAPTPAPAPAPDSAPAPTAENHIAALQESEPAPTSSGGEQADAATTAAPSSAVPDGSDATAQPNESNGHNAPTVDQSVGETLQAAQPAVTNGGDAAPAPAVPAPKVVIEAVEPASSKKDRSKLQESSTIRREVEVGVERFRAVDSVLLEQIADTVHRCILSVPEINKRSELWDALVILGNGSKIKGFKDALLATLNNKYLISPSSATIFTSELPSNMSTPAGTGANTPQPQMPPSHHASGVNPLLLAATTASNPALAPPMPGTTTPSGQPSSQQLQQQGHHSSHGQTPTSIKLAKMAEYFPEWKEAGFDEAHFLGAQVAAKIIFVIDQGLSKGFMTRTEYNELGPQGIHEFAMC